MYLTKCSIEFWGASLTNNIIRDRTVGENSGDSGSGSMCGVVLAVVSMYFA